METILHAARYWILIPLALLVVWLAIIVWHDGLGGLMRKKTDRE